MIMITLCRGRIICEQLVSKVDCFLTFSALNSLAHASADAALKPLNDVKTCVL